LRRGRLHRRRDVTGIIKAGPGRTEGHLPALLIRRVNAFDAAATVSDRFHANRVIGIIATGGFSWLRWLRVGLRRGRLRRPGYVAGVIKAGRGRTEGPLPALLVGRVNAFDAAATRSGGFHANRIIGIIATSRGPRGRRDQDRPYAENGASPCTHCNSPR